MNVINNAVEQRFEILLDDSQVAFADYSLLEGKVMFPHTVVPPEHEGQGLASALARSALAWARDEKLTVIPSCSFFVTYMQRHPETHDLLDPGYAGLMRS